MGDVDNLQNAEEAAYQRKEAAEQKEKARLEQMLAQEPLKDTASKRKEWRELPVDVINQTMNIRLDLPEVHEMAISIKEKGLITPLVVQPNADDDGRTYNLIAGARRLAALELLGQETVMCSIIDDLSEAEVVELQFTENVQRVDLPPVQAARALRYIMDLNPQTTLAKLARSLALEPPWVQKHFRLLDLPKSIQDKLDSGDMTFYVADMLRKAVKTKRLSLNEAEQLAEDYVAGIYKSGEVREKALPTPKPRTFKAEEVGAEDATNIQETLQTYEGKPQDKVGGDIEDAVILEGGHIEDSTTGRRWGRDEFDPSKNTPPDQRARIPAQEIAGQEDQRHGAQRVYTDVPPPDYNELKEKIDRYILTRALQEWAPKDYLQMQDIDERAVVAYTETLHGPQVTDELRHLALWLIQNP